MNRTASYLAAAALSATLAATVAQADENRAPADAMGEQAISQIVSYAGFDVVDIDLDQGVYRVEAYEPAGTRVELRLLAEDGSVLPAESTRHDGRRAASQD